MTNQQYTPTVDELRRVYALKVPHDQRDRRNAEFDRFLSAAEQRGAIKALREAADEFAPEWSDKPGLSATRGVSQTRKWLRNRADQMEGFNDSRNANAA